MSNAIKYRPEIDGLRAIAVIAVIFFHFHVLGFTGGYVGVDVFFVISGYLITSIILKDCESGSFSLLHFYQRRIRRILPLALVVCFLTFCAAYALYDKYIYQNNTHVLKRSLIFISNFLIAEKHDYFAPESFDLLFIHSWSLSIEEQFYILFPLLFIMSYKYANKKLRYIWIILAIISFVFNVIYIRIEPKYGFYSPFSRAWELMAGAILAMSKDELKLPEKLTKWLPYFAVAMLVCSFFMYNNSIAYPGAYTLLPVFATVLLIYSLKNSRTYVNKILTFNPVVFTGKISYSLYMWHYPLCILAGSLYLTEVPLIVKLCLLTGLYILSVFSYYVIERPFRNGYFKPKISVAIIAISWIAVFATIKLSVDNKNGKFGNENYRFAAEEDKKQAFLRKHEVTAISAASSNYLKVYKIGCTDSVPGIVLYGDSHAAALAYGVDSIAKQNKVAAYLITQPGYPPIYGVYREAFKDSIINAHKLVLKFLQDHKELKTVILTARWSCYSGGLIKLNNKLKIGHDGSGKVYSQDGLLTLGVENMIDTISKMGKSVAITTSAPEIRCWVYKMTVIHEVRKMPYEYFAYSDTEYLNLNKFFLTFLGQLERQKKAVIIDVAKSMLYNNRYRIVSGNKLLYSDDNHLSPYGSLVAAKAFEPLFKNTN